MPGSLYHARRFEKRPYIGGDGLRHWEIEPIDGDADVVSHSSWGELVRHCAQFGVPEDIWPILDRECAIDVLLDDIESMQPPFRAALRLLSPAQISSHDLLSRIVTYLDRNEIIFFTD
jgi:hypothetical protein